MTIISQAAHRAALFLGAASLLVTPGTGADTLKAPEINAAQSCVVLLHGMGRTAQSMRKLEKALTREGYLTHNQNYPSREGEIHVLATQAVDAGVEYCRAQSAPKIHFVTHSLGGILLRIYLQNQTLPELQRIVMLAPPNQGSEVADELKGFILYQKIFGDIGQNLGTEPNDLIKRLKPISGEIGIIAGTKSLDPWFSPILPGKDDGKVSVDGTRLLEMQDFIEVPAAHWSIMRKKVAITEALFFLKNGVFSTHPSLKQAIGSQ